MAALLGMIDRPTRSDLLTYVAAMVLLIIVGVIGASLHIKHDLTAGGVTEEEEKRHMGFLLLVLGVGWVLIGVSQIVSGWQTEASITGALLYYSLLFILPGLAVAGIGYVLRVWARQLKDYADVVQEQSRLEQNEHNDT